MKHPRSNALFDLSQVKRVLAPMVDASELTWRVLCRRYGAELCFTPMFHSRLFHESVKYRHEMFFWSDYEGSTGLDRPLIIQVRKYLRRLMD